MLPDVQADTTRFFTSDLGTFRVTRAKGSPRSGTKTFDVFMTLDGQEQPLGTLLESDEGDRRCFGASSTITNANELLRHVARSLP